MLGTTDGVWKPYSLRGITISVPELGSKSLALEVAAGINVLYGLNGVGKSRVLSAIPDATFDLHAPVVSDDGMRYNPLWLMLEPWSFGHELELDWPGRDSGAEFPNFWDGDDVSDVIDFFTGAYRGSDWESVTDSLSPIINSGEDGLVQVWVLRLAYFVAEVQRLSSDDDRVLVLEAVTEFVHQGRVRLRRVPEANSESAVTTWEVEYLAEVVPDEARLWRWVQTAANRVVEQVLNSDRNSNDRVGQRAEWEILDSDLCRLNHDAVYDAVDPLLAEVAGYSPGYLLNPLSTSRIYEIFSRKLNNGVWHPFKVELPINFISDDARTLADDGLRHVQHLVDASPAFHATEPSQPWRSAERTAQLQEFMFGPVDAPSVSQETRLAAATLSEAANRELHRLLLSANPIRARLPEPGEWPTLGKLIWESEDRQGQWVPLEALSETQQRLAALAIKIATYGSSTGITILVLDEPERGLHRLAERHLLEGLRGLTDLYPDLVIIVASHSPSFLRPDIARLHHVERDSEGSVRIQSLPNIDLNEIEQLGLSASDLLQLTRVVVLVEGAHEEWVLEAMYGEDFAAMGVRVLSMRGAKQLRAAAEGRLLFDFTEAHVVVLLDNTNAKSARETWELACQSWRNSTGENSDSRKQAVLEIVDRMHRSRDDTEGKALKEFCNAAIFNERFDRVRIAGLSKPDIQEYFDSHHFAGKKSPAATFQELRRQWEDAGGSGRLGPHKRWLTTVHGFKFTRTNFRSAVEAAVPHEDFQDLYRQVDELCRRVGQR